MENPNVALQVLLDAGISESVAISMLKVLEPKEKKTGKKRSGGFIARAKIDVPVVVVRTCLTCKSVTSFKLVMKVYEDERDIEQSTVVGQCQNCIEQLRLMDKEDLISLIVIMNHSDIELRNLSTASQIAMASKRTPTQWLTLKMNHAIAWGDKDENDSTSMEGVNLNRR